YLPVTLHHLGTPLFPYTTLFRSGIGPGAEERRRDSATDRDDARGAGPLPAAERPREPRVLRRLVRGAGSERSHRLGARGGQPGRSEEHTSELQSLRHLVCRLLLE